MMRNVLESIVLSENFTNQEKYDLIELIIRSVNGEDVLEDTDYYLGVVKAKNGNKLFAVHRYEDMMSFDVEHIISLLYTELLIKQDRTR